MERSYYENKKIKFANSNYENGYKEGKYGEKYGFTLEDPMKLETIEKYEHTYNLQLPKRLRNYLLNISSETIGVYSYKIELDEPELIFIHKIKDHCPDLSRHHDLEYDNLSDIKKLHELGYYENYFIKTYVNGCTDDDFLCIKGPKYGRGGSYRAGGDYFRLDDESCDLQFKEFEKFKQSKIN